MSRAKSRFVAPPTGEQQAWLTDQMAKQTTPERVNPCVALFGKGPDGKTCRTCAQLMRRGGASKVYLKCALRKNTNGPATDHRAGWMACSKYEEAKS